jgi:hypothetical protein
VINGLSAGDRVVVDGVLKVQPGGMVKAVPIDVKKENMTEQAAEGAKPASTQAGMQSNTKAKAGP